MTDMVLQRILVATDFSEPSMLALQAAASWARRFGASMELLHVYDPSPPPGAALLEHAWPVDMAGLQASARSELEALRERWLREVSDVRLTVQASSSAALAIGDWAREQAVDLVVVGSHGRSGWSRALLGSVAEQVVRVAPCPVLCVRGDRATPEKVLACTDFSRGAESAVDMAMGIARAFASTVTVVHVYDPKAWEPSGATTAKVERDLGAAVASLHGRSFEQGVHTAVLQGEKVAEVLTGFAERSSADLLVLATHGRSGVPRLFVGSVAERVMRHAPCSVLVTRVREEGT